MGLFLIFVAVLVTGVVLAIIGSKNDIDGLTYPFGALAMVGGMGVIILIVAALIANCNPNKTLVYEKMADTREAIIRRLEGSGGIIATYADYEAAVDYNSGVRAEKMMHDNFFLNWYANPLVAENLDYIDINQYLINYNI